MASAQDYVNACLAEQGIAERPANSNHVPYWDEIGLPGLQGQPWCGAFVTAIARRIGIGDQVNYVYCPTGRSEFAARGALMPDPQPGDLCFFEWEHDLLVDHTGVVVSVNGDGTINTIEGNTRRQGEGNDSVETRVRSLSVCRGFGRVNWPAAIVTNVVVVHPAPAPPTAGNNPGSGHFAGLHPTVQQGSIGGAVPHLQLALGVATDGQFGPGTKRALVAAQLRLGIAADGVCGPDSWSHLHAVCAKGSTGGAVSEVQQQVGCLDDGQFGGITDAAVRDYQRTKGLGADGVVGPQTYRAMF